MRRGARRGSENGRWLRIGIPLFLVAALALASAPVKADDHPITRSESMVMVGKYCSFVCAYPTYTGTYHFEQTADHIRVQTNPEQPIRWGIGLLTVDCTLDLRTGEVSGYIIGDDCVSLRFSADHAPDLGEGMCRSWAVVSPPASSMIGMDAVGTCS